MRYTKVLISYCNSSFDRNSQNVAGDLNHPPFRRFTAGTSGFD